VEVQGHMPSFAMALRLYISENGIGAHRYFVLPIDLEIMVSQPCLFLQHSAANPAAPTEVFPESLIGSKPPALGHSSGYAYANLLSKLLQSWTLLTTFRPRMLDKTPTQAEQATPSWILTQLYLMSEQRLDCT
jgi:hypothetical protein